VPILTEVRGEPPTEKVVAPRAKDRETMADSIVWDQFGLRQRALALLAVADRVKSEGWNDGVEAQLRRAAHELIVMVSDSPAAVANQKDAEIAATS
jgi:hypothetical protein